MKLSTLSVTTNPRTLSHLLAFSLCLFALASPGSARAQCPPSLACTELLTEQQQIMADDGLSGGNAFGDHVAISGDTLVVTADYAAGLVDGAAFVFVRNGSNWIHQAKLVAADAKSMDWFGKSSVAIDGNTIVVGAMYEPWPDEMGAAYVFVRDGTNWTQQAKLIGHDRSFANEFGTSVAVSGDTVVIGAPHDDDRGWGSGSVYVFVRNGTNWTHQAKLLAPDGAAYDYFGKSVAISGNTLVAGVPYDDEPVTSGSAFVFVRNGTTWTQQAKLRPNDPRAYASFGYAMGISADTIVASAAYDDSLGTNYGSAYVFVRNGTLWTQQAKLVAPYEAATCYLGWTVGISGEKIVLGTVGWAIRQGIPPSALVYVRSGTSWILQATLRGALGASGENFGRAVAIDGDTVLVGAMRESPGVAYIFTPGYQNELKVADYVKRFLYPHDAASFGICNPGQTAFRYKYQLYQNSGGQVRSRYETNASFLAGLYGPIESAQAHAAEAELLKGLACNPQSALLGELLLDIYYDRTVPLAFYARAATVGSDRARYGPPLAAPAPAAGFIIDNEISACASVLDSNRVALASYFSLLTNTFGFAANPPLGCQIFQTRVPTRPLEPARYTNASGQLVSVITNAGPLFDGYKDLVLLYGLLRDHGRAAATLARLHLARGEREAVQQHLTQAQRFLSLHANLLLGLFPNLVPPAGSGLDHAISAVNDSLDELAKIQQSLGDNANPLGFTDDFLLLVRKDAGVQDSFDVLKNYLEPSGTLSPLNTALFEQDELETHYSDYRGYEDQLAGQFADSSITYADRLRDIVGVFPGDIRYSENPTNNPGSELDQQYRAIELARTRILRNQTEIGNLRQQVQIELAKAAAISNVMIDFGNRRASIIEQIGAIEAAQASMNALADAFDPGKWTKGDVVSGVFGVFNAAAQGAGEVGKSQLEADKERLAAQEQATIVGLETDATVKTLLLSMSTLAVDSQEAGLNLLQEMNRLQGLYREKKDLEARMAERDSRLAQRYFADPVHLLSVQSGMIRADLAFQEAQKWLFFMSRALEYKWNKAAWTNLYLGRTYSAKALYKLRNANELKDFYLAMVNFDASPGFSYTPDPLIDWFSVREDFFGFHRTNRLGQLQYYTDPHTGERLDAIQSFRRQLRRFHNDASRLIHLEFSTVREIPGGTFFRGPRFYPGGAMWSKGYFLDKLDSVMINLPGSHTLGRTKLAGQLVYGGSSFLRNFSPGTLAPNRPDRLRNELTAYDTRYWYYNLDTALWEAAAAQSVPIDMQLSVDPRVPNAVLENAQFSERGVAASRWELLIPTWEGNIQLLDIDELDDIELQFKHHAMPRP